MQTITIKIIMIFALQMHLDECTFQRLLCLSVHCAFNFSQGCCMVLELLTWTTKWLWQVGGMGETPEMRYGVEFGNWSYQIFLVFRCFSTTMRTEPGFKLEDWKGGAITTPSLKPTLLPSALQLVISIQSKRKPIVRKIIIIIIITKSIIFKVGAPLENVMQSLLP